MKTLISAFELQALLHSDRNVVLFDCSSVLTDPSAGAKLYTQAHVPGAHFLDLNRDLSDMSKLSTQGRHPLPDPNVFALKLAQLGIVRARDAHRRIVCYDQDHGAYAARAWWLLNALGFENCYVLDGGLARWKAAGFAISDQPSPVVDIYPVVDVNIDAPETNDFAGMPVIGFEELIAAQAKGLPGLSLLDARAADRFAGINETIDPIAGHIPGAINRPFLENLQRDENQCWMFKSPKQLRQDYDALQLEDDTVAMCGSGVTACHIILAMIHAGFVGPHLFAESWSGWITRELPRDQAS
jgi:thiosulfate/3-mercaptopyruvate sulfurtransferase